MISNTIPEDFKIQAESLSTNMQRSRHTTLMTQNSVIDLSLSQKMELQKSASLINIQKNECQIQDESLNTNMLRSRHTTLMTQNSVIDLSLSQKMQLQKSASLINIQKNECQIQDESLNSSMARSRHTTQKIQNSVIDLNISLKGELQKSASTFNLQKDDCEICFKKIKQKSKCQFCYSKVCKYHIVKKRRNIYDLQTKDICEICEIKYIKQQKNQQHQTQIDTALSKNQQDITLIQQLKEQIENNKNALKQMDQNLQNSKLDSQQHQNRIRNEISDLQIDNDKKSSKIKAYQLKTIEYQNKYRDTIDHVNTINLNLQTEDMQIKEFDRNIIGIQKDLKQQEYKIRCLTDEKNLKLQNNNNKSSLFMDNSTFISRKNSNSDQTNSKIIRTNQRKNNKYENKLQNVTFYSVKAIKQNRMSKNIKQEENCKACACQIF